MVRRVLRLWRQCTKKEVQEKRYAQLIKPQPAPQEDHGEDTDKQDERASGHLIDRDRRV